MHSSGDVLTIRLFISECIRIALGLGIVRISKSYELTTKSEGWQSLVYRGGLENRCGFIPTGGSNPLPSVFLPLPTNLLTRMGEGLAEHLEREKRTPNEAPYEEE
jgi:hypothetical protein